MIHTVLEINVTVLTGRYTFFVLCVFCVSWLYRLAINFPGEKLLRYSFFVKWKYSTTNEKHSDTWYSSAIFKPRFVLCLPAPANNYIKMFRNLFNLQLKLWTEPTALGFFLYNMKTKQQPNKQTLNIRLRDQQVTIILTKIDQISMCSNFHQFFSNRIMPNHFESVFALGTIYLSACNFSTIIRAYLNIFRHEMVNETLKNTLKKWE